MQYWLIKNERDCYSINDLKEEKTTAWTEVRNYQARNFMREMKKGDALLYYHSNAGPETGVVGEAKVIKEAYPDPTQFKKKGEYFDPKATKDEPRWSCVDVRYVATFKTPVYLSELKNDPAFDDMIVTRRGNRLSIMPVSKKHYAKIIKMGNS
jgi:predicted RNA-binding protein with PUA-like domain